MNNLNKLSLIFFSVLFLSFSGCKDDGTGPAANGSLLTISGKANGWALGDTMTAVASRLVSLTGSGSMNFIFGTSAIASDGSFSLALSTPPPEALKRYRTSLTPSLTVSDTSTMHVVFGFLGIRLPDGSNYSKALDNANKP